jgi:hypothetical protein
VAEVAPAALEERLRGRVVQVDVVRVRKQELDPAQRVLRRAAERLRATRRELRDRPAEVPSAVPPLTISMFCDAM